MGCDVTDLVREACECIPDIGEEKRGNPLHPREIAVDVSPIVAYRVRLERRVLEAGGVRDDLVTFYRKERDELRRILKACRYHGRTQVLDEERHSMVVVVRPDVLERELSFLDRHLSSSNGD